MSGRFLVFCLTPSLLCSCFYRIPDVDSTDIRTTGIHAQFEAWSEGTGTVKVTGSLRVGDAGGTLMELKGKDQLWGQVGTTKLRFSGGDGNYLLRTDNDGNGTNITVSLTRGGEDKDAPESKLRLPAAFTPSFDGLSRGDAVPRGTPIKLRWSPSGPGSMTYSLSGNCIYPTGARTSDDGEAVIAPEQIVAFAPKQRQSCDVTIQMERRSSGSVDPNFGEGGGFRGYQTRRINFTSTPEEGEIEPPTPANEGGAPGAAEPELGGTRS